MDIYLLILVLFFSLAALLPDSSSSSNTKYDACSKKLECGHLGHDIGYPFYDGSTRPKYCGYPGFKIDNCTSTPQITISNSTYDLNYIQGDDYDSTITVSRNDTWESSCPDRLSNTTIDFSKFDLLPSNQNVTFFYGCGDQSNKLSSLNLTTTCDLGGYGSLGGYYLTQAMLDEHHNLNLLRICKSNVFLPVTKSRAEAIDSHPNDVGFVISAFEAGFELGLIANNTACHSCIHLPDSFHISTYFNYP